MVTAAISEDLRGSDNSYHMHQLVYIQTRDIFHIKYLMGHRNIESTLHYVHIAKGLVNYSEDYTVKVAKSLDEWTSLLKQGFEYISDYENAKVLRKRK